MHPIVHKLMAREALALGDFIFVVWKNIVYAPSVNIELLTEILHRHSTALDMPAGETASPRTIPGHLATRLGYLPQRKVLDIVAIGIDAFVNPRHHMFKQVAG